MSYQTVSAPFGLAHPPVRAGPVMMVQVVDAGNGTFAVVDQPRPDHLWVESDDTCFKKWKRGSMEELLVALMILSFVLLVFVLLPSKHQAQVNDATHRGAEGGLDIVTNIGRGGKFVATNVKRGGEVIATDIKASAPSAAKGGEVFATNVNKGGDSVALNVGRGADVLVQAVGASAPLERFGRDCR